MASVQPLGAGTSSAFKALFGEGGTHRFYLLEELVPVSLESKKACPALQVLNPQPAPHALAPSFKWEFYCFYWDLDVGKIKEQVDTWFRKAVAGCELVPWVCH